MGLQILVIQPVSFGRLWAMDIRARIGARWDCTLPNDLGDGHVDPASVWSFRRSRSLHSSVATMLSHIALPKATDVCCDP